MTADRTSWPLGNVLIGVVLGNGVEGGQAGIVIPAPFVRLSYEGEDMLDLGHPSLEAPCLLPVPVRYRVIRRVFQRVLSHRPAIREPAPSCLPPRAHP